MVQIRVSDMRAVTSPQDFTVKRRLLRPFFFRGEGLCLRLFGEGFEKRKFPGLGQTTVLEEQQGESHQADDELFVPGIEGARREDCGAREEPAAGELPEKGPGARARRGGGGG